MNVNLIRNLLRGKEDKIIKNSLQHCHTKNVTSILFDDTPGSKIRMFIAKKGHKLWKNKAFEKYDLSVGFHNHHCNLELECVHRTFWNSTAFWTRQFPRVESKFKACEFVSPILHAKGFFHGIGNVTIEAVNSIEVCSGERFSLNSKELHTIYVPKNEEAAWMVYEMEEDTYYKSVCISNVDLTKLDISNLYRPITGEQLYKDLSIIYPDL